ncbi:recombinase family protein [Kocuria marina]|uniref:recombinase family protein n=1 Tax=Kocuria TaxID=57493 RepID=UPI00296EE815
MSTREQAASLDTQRAALQAAGCERVFTDTISGARSTRPAPAWTQPAATCATAIPCSSPAWTG